MVHPELKVVSPPDPALLNAGTTATWQNLGYWTHNEGYRDAARALAVHLGEALALEPKDRVIDVGCGCGDQLSVWRRQFGVNSVLAYEPHGPSAARAADRANDLGGVRVEQASDADLRDQQASAILSLDAAYHFPSRREFLRCAASGLAPGGRLGVTDLFVPSRGPGLRARTFAWAAGIPQRNLWSRAQWHDELDRAGFEVQAWTDLTTPVFAGFGGFGRRVLSRALRSPRWGWLPILGTALVTASAARGGWIGYAQVVATAKTS